MNRQYSALSGGAAVLIVLNHAIHFGLQVAPVEGRWLHALSVLQALGGVFAVPTFLFISGAFLSYTADELSFNFVRRTLERILWPYVVWATIFHAVMFLAGGQHYSASEFVRNLLVGYPYHFVPLLVFWYVMAPIVVPAGKRHGASLLVVVALYQVFLLGMVFLVFDKPGPVPGWAHFVVPPVLFLTMSEWAIYLPLGLVLSLHEARLKPFLLRVRPIALTISLVAFGLGLLNAFKVVPAPWARFVAPVALMLLLPTIARGSIPFVRWFEQLGRRTYGIYLVHFVVVNLVVLVIARIHPSLANVPAIVYPTFLALGLGVSLLVMDGMAKVPAARRVYRFIFGVVPPPVKTVRPSTPGPKRQPNHGVTSDVAG